jgi:predicted Zn-dependent protease
MRGILKFLLTILVIGATVAFFAKGSIVQAEKVLRSETNPCGEPLRYYIASIDPKFGLSEKQVIEDMNQAASLWNSATGKQVFVYDPQGTLPVYFVYDKRQALNSQINQMEKSLNNGSQTLSKQMADFKQKVSDYQSKLKAYNEEVQSWNNRGGAPEDVYNNLQQQSQELKAEADRLNEEAKQLNLEAKNYNGQVLDLNMTIDSFNQTLSQQPEEGIYIEERTNLFDPGNKKVEIYFVPSREELIHTLAHEFGHALHIDHNTNAKSIMFSYTSESLKLSKEDLEALTMACEPRSLTSVLQEKLTIMAGNYQRLFSGNLVNP